MTTATDADLPPSQVSGGEPEPTSSKPPRIRTACTECHAAKVRCSSEKPGCTRCQQNGLSCVYKLSMVGRTSKRRHDADGALNRRKRSISTLGPRPLGSSTPAPVGGTIHALVPDMAEADPGRFISPESYFSSADKSAYGSHIEFDDDSFVWNWELPGDDEVAEPPGEDGEGVALLDQRTAKEAYPSLSSLGASTTTSESSLPNLPSNSDDSNEEGSSERMAQLMSLCRMTDGLETHLQSRTGSLDEIMKVNKACLAEVVRLTSRRRKGPVCRCSFLMITSCLDIMLVLFEDVVRSSGLDPGSGGRRSDARMPSLQFGVFELDPQEQLVITRRILARELQNYREVVRALALESGDTGADFFQKLMRQWRMSATSRLGQLLMALEKPGGNSANPASYGQSMFL